MRAKIDPESTVTAGNSSGQNDAAAMCLVTTRAKADELGLEPLVRLRSWGVAGVRPDIMVLREWKFGEADLERVNVHGSGIYLGHPVGATGVRMPATLAREMKHRDLRYGLETMCLGGGQGLAALFERVV